MAGQIGDLPELFYDPATGDGRAARKIIRQGIPDCQITACQEASPPTLLVGTQTFIGISRIQQEVHALGLQDGQEISGGT